MLMELPIRRGSLVLDYGCDPGSFTVPLSKLVGVSERVYALDHHPLAIKKVKALVSRRRLENVEIIQSDCETNLKDQTVDVVLLFDVFHELDNTGTALTEFHRVLRPDGVLSFSDHHMHKDDIIHAMTEGKLFRLDEEGRGAYRFRKAKP
jgi:ubiquinone/menaquinone biosynthesis C-methylase UbiE